MPSYFLLSSSGYYHIYKYYKQSFLFDVLKFFFISVTKPLLKKHFIILSTIIFIFFNIRVVLNNCPLVPPIVTLPVTVTKEKKITVSLPEYHHGCALCPYHSFYSCANRQYLHSDTLHTKSHSINWNNSKPTSALLLMTSTPYGLVHHTLL